MTYILEETRERVRAIGTQYADTQLRQEALLRAIVLLLGETHDLLQRMVDADQERSERESLAESVALYKEAGNG